MGKKTYTQEQHDLIVKLNNSGIQRKDIAKILGKTPASISQYCMRNGISRPPFVSEETKKKIIQLKGQGLNGMQIAQKVGYKRSFVYSFLKNAGYDMPHTPLFWRDDKCKLLEETILNSFNLQEVADKMGKSYSSIKNKLYNEYGTYIFENAKEIIKEEREWEEKR